MLVKQALPGFGPGCTGSGGTGLHMERVSFWDGAGAAVLVTIVTWRSTLRSKVTCKCGAFGLLEWDWKILEVDFNILQCIVYRWTSFKEWQSKDDRCGMMLLFNVLYTYEYKVCAKLSWWKKYTRWKIVCAFFLCILRQCHLDSKALDQISNTTWSVESRCWLVPREILARV